MFGCLFAFENYKFVIKISIPNIRGCSASNADMSLVTVVEDALANIIDAEPKTEKHIPRLIEMVTT